LIIKKKGDLEDETSKKDNSNENSKAYNFLSLFKRDVSKVKFDPVPKDMMPKAAEYTLEVDYLCAIL
jgi:hypothetical protein